MKAFPWHEGFEKEAGMDLRDYFAAKAMQGLLANQGYFVYRDRIDTSKNCYEIADAMMEAREK
jgi:hypothetical protein